MQGISRDCNYSQHKYIKRLYLTLRSFCFDPEGLHSFACGCKIREDRGRQPAAAETSCPRRCWEGKASTLLTHARHSIHTHVLMLAPHCSLHCNVWVSSFNNTCVCVCIQSGLTPLHVAAHYDNQKVALLLLNQGASPHAAAKVKNMEVLRCSNAPIHQPFSLRQKAS